MNFLTRYIQQQIIVTKQLFIVGVFFVTFTPVLVFAGAIVAGISANTPSSFGHYQESVEDLKVKVLGGYVRVTRKWENGKWHINKNWAKLFTKFSEPYTESDSIVGGGGLAASITTLTYNGQVFNGVESSGKVIIGPVIAGRSKTYAYNLYQKDTGTKLNQFIVWTGSTFRWKNIAGSWVEFDGTIISLNAALNAIAQGDSNNVGITLQYNDSNVSGVFDHLNNQVLWYEYNAAGQISAVRDYTARRVEYTYTDGVITKVKDVRGNVWIYTYSSGEIKQLLTKTNPNGRITTITYSPSGSVTSILDQDLVGSTFKYEFLKDKKEFYKQEKTAGGKVTETWLNSKGELIRSDINGVTVKTIAIEDRKRTITDRSGNKTQEEEDEWGNVIKVTHPDNSFATKKYEPTTSNLLEEVDERGIVTKYEYDAKGNLTKKIEAFGLPEQRVIIYVPDAYGNVATTTYEADAVSPQVSSHATYDDYGNMVTRTDGEGHVWRYTHDVMGNVLTTIEPASTKTWTYTYDNAGNQTSMKDPMGHLTQYEYDGLGNRTKVIDAKLHNTIRTYDLRNRLTEIIDHLGNKQVMDYDLDGRLIKSTDQSNKVTVYTYYPDGKPFTIMDGSNNTITLKYHKEGVNGAGQASSMEYPTFTRVFAYDVRGRVVSQTDVLSPTKQLITAFGHDSVGNRTLVTDPTLRKTVYAFDGLNRISKMTDALIQDTLYGYDNRGNLRTVTDPNTNTTTYVYDGNNNILSETRPMSQVYTYTYNTAGHLAIRIDAKDQKAEYLYDDAGRNTTIKHYATSAATTPAKTVALNYDAANLLDGYDDGTSSATYTYDELNRKTLETVNYGGFSKAYGYGYYKNGHKKTYTAPDGVTHTFSYNAANHLSAIQIPGAGAITFNRFEWKKPKSVTFPGGTTVNVNYDGLMRIKNISIKDPAQNPVMNYGYTMDDVGNITNQQTEHGAYQYGYDKLGRLEMVDNPNLQDETYTYDPVGNRLTDNNKPGTWGYNNNNQLTGIAATTSFVYDDNGSTISKTEGGTTTDYVYNLENRLSEAKQGASTIATYYYDPFGRRLSKTVGGTTTYFMYADEGLIAEFTATGTPIRQYGYQPDGLWGTDLTYLKTGGQYYYYQNDHLGTPKKLTAANGQVVWSAEYLAFGELQVADASLIENPLRFSGQYFDQQTNLNYNYNRYYDPENGRYTTSDPIGLAGGLNIYAYVFANPIMNVDPRGLAACCSGGSTTDMACVIRSNERFQSCSRFNRIMNVTCQWICTRIPNDRVEQGCGMVCDAGLRLDTENCREWLQEDLLECTSEDCD
jgi:RHS repeat-associated protein